MNPNLAVMPLFTTTKLLADASVSLFQGRPSISESTTYDIYAMIIAIILFFVVLTLIFLIPQAFGLAAYRLLKPYIGLSATLIGFLLPPVLYCLFFGYFWYNASPIPASELPSGEGDMVIPAVIGYGLVVNLAAGLILYCYLFIKNLAQLRARNES